MMGIQATAGKRKLEAVVASSGVAASSNCEDSTTTIPAKAGRWADNTTPVLPSVPVVIATNNNNSTTSNNPIVPSMASTASSITPPPIPQTPPPPPTSDDCIARLRAVAVPGETTTTTTSSNSNVNSSSNSWQHSSSSSLVASSSSALATTLLSEDLDDDDLDDYDDFSDEDRCADVPYPPTTPQGYQPARYPDFSQYQNQRQQGYYHSDDPFQTQYLNRTPNRAGGPYWNNYYTQTQPQQTIRCDENGKSYLELGSAPPPIPQPRPPIRCCDGPTRWCNYPCYRQRRLAVLNLSMFKLARYRQCSDPSLHRSVLICNTLRLIEREMEAEGNQIAAYQAQQQHQQQIEAQSYPSTPFNEYTNSRLTPVIEPSVSSYEHNLRELSASGRATPFPTQTMDTDSGLGDEDTSRSINWSSVLSLTSQTDLDPLNNNELYQSVDGGASSADIDMPMNDVNSMQAMDTTPTLTSSSTSQLMDEFLPTWNKNSSSCSVDDSLRTEQYNNRFPGEGEWDSFMQVLVGGS